jgi:hypothetical protein
LVERLSGAAGDQAQDKVGAKAAHLPPAVTRSCLDELAAAVNADIRETAASWGPQTARHLPHGQAIVLPETGHGAPLFSQCARDLGVAFIENPTVPLDKSCVAGLKPSFVLPEGQAAGQAGGTSK